MCEPSLQTDFKIFMATCVLSIYAIYLTLMCADKKHFTVMTGVFGWAILSDWGLAGWSKPKFYRRSCFLVLQGLSQANDKYWASYVSIDNAIN